MLQLRFGWAACVVLIVLVGCGDNSEPSKGETVSITSFAADKSEGTAPLAVTFSWNIEAEGKMLTCVITFGDDVSETLEPCANVGTQAHTYAAAGSYSAILTVTSGGEEVSKTADVVVTDGATDPNPSPNPPPTPGAECGGANDTPETACVLSLGVTQSAKVDEDRDVDYYRFTTAETGVATALVASVPAGVFLTVVLYDANNQELDRTGLSSSTTATFPILSDAGTFYLSVTGSKASDDPYEVSVNFDDSDPYELNNTDETPTPLPVGETLKADINGVAYTTGQDISDNDYYLYKTEQPGVAEILLSSVPAGQSIRVSMLDAQKQPIRIPSFATSAQPRQFLVLSEPGKFYIQVNANSGSTESYDLSVNLNTSDSNEPNNDPDSAKPLIMGQSVKGAIYGFDVANTADLDYYSFTTTAASSVSLTAPTTAALKIQVSTSGNSDVCSKNVFKGQSATCPIEAAGEYTVLVQGSNGSVSSPEPYTLNLTQ